ncbi:MAG: response regulator transcription factor [Chloroflexi bacterium]|nr:response regulator transcription factor [Chloroflexota bacterium]
MTKLLIVDDHPVVRQGLRRLLEREEDIEVVGEVADGKLAIEEARNLKPDIVLMDINLPSMNGLQATREIKASNPQIALITLTAYHNSSQMFHAMRAGASAYYPKEVSTAELLQGIRAAIRGRYVIAGKELTEKQLNTWLLDQFTTIGIGGTDYPEEMFKPLSAREMQILQQIAKGLSNKEIARELGISRQTVKNHMTSILRKLDVEDRTQVALYALRLGWIRLEDTQ